jgi:hypothetical protein
MAGKSDYGEGLALDTLLAGTVYIAVSVTTPTDAGAMTEPAVGSYARIATTFTRSGDTSGNALADHPQATAAWGLLGYWAIFDAITSGNMLYWDVLDATVQIDNTDILRWPVDSLEVTED